MSAVAEVIGLQEGVRRGGRIAWTPLLRIGSLIAILAALVAAAVLGEPQTFVVAWLGLGIGLAIVWLCFRGADRQFLLTLFLTAFALRVVGAVVSHHLLVLFGRDGFLLLDDRAYDKLGWTLARVWMGIFPGIRDTDEYLMVNYTYLVAIVYFFLGHALLTAKMMNVAFGALTGVVLYALGREIFDQRTARIAAVLTAFFPSLVVWSIINLKDILVVLLTATAVLGLVRYGRRHEWWALALCLAAFLAIENLRQFVFFILTWLLPVAFLFLDRSERPGDWRAMIATLALGLGLLKAADLLLGSDGFKSITVLLPWIMFAPTGLFLALRAERRRKLLLLIPLLIGVTACSVVTNNEKFGTNFLTPKALTEAEWKRWLEETRAETGNDAFGGIKPPKDASDIVERSVAYLPRGVFYVLFGPTPWNAPTPLAKAVQPEMITWYLLLAAALVGLARTAGQKWRDLLLPLGFAASWIVALALTEGNAGNIFRHRSMFMPFIFLVSAAGLHWLWYTWQRRRTASARSAGEATS